MIPNNRKLGHPARFQSIYLIEYADKVPNKRQYKGYCLLSNERAIVGNAHWPTEKIQYFGIILGGGKSCIYWERLTNEWCERSKRLMTF